MKETQWLPPKASEALQKEWADCLIFVRYGNDGEKKIKRVLTDKEAKKLSNWTLVDVYVNWEFVGSNWDYN